MLHDTTRTDAVAEDVFLEVWRRAARFDPAQLSAMNWMLDLARELALARCQADASRGDRGPDGADDGPSWSDLRGAGDDGLVRAAFAELTEQQQRALEFASVGGYSNHDLAAQLGTPVLAFQTLLRDGLIHLRAELRAREERARR